MLVDGQAVKIASPRHAFDSGIAMVFQEQSILPTLTVAENIFLGREEEFLRYGLISKARMNEAAAVELKKVHLDCHPGTRCADLTFADRQMVEIAKALSLDSRIKGDVTILLDEPTSVLERKEVELLFEIIARSQAARLHRLHLAPARRGAGDLRPRLCHARRQGGEGACRQGGDRQGPAPAYGRPPAAPRILPRSAPGRAVDKGRARMRAASARMAPSHDISFALHEGEIIGIAGVIGSGREDLARCLAGHTPADRGTLKVDGTPSSFGAAA